MFLHPKDDSNGQCYQKQLGQQNASMPTVREKLMIVNLAKGNEQGQKHKQRENDIEHRSQRITSLIQ
jgi:hypothetical protein